MTAEAVLASVRARRSASVADAQLALSLMASSDLAARRSLAAVAAPLLTDGAVLATWLAVAAAEPDDALRAALIVRASRVDAAVIPADLRAAWQDLLVAGVSLPAARSACLMELRAVLPTHPPLADALIAVIPSITDRATCAQIEALLLQVTRPTPTVLAWWRERLRSGQGESRPAVVAALLERDALDATALDALVLPGEPLAVRRTVLAHGLDRGGLSAVTLATVLRADDDAACRRLALVMSRDRLSDEDLRAAMVDVARSDPHGPVRHDALQALAEAPHASATVAVISLLQAERESSVLATVLPQVGPGLARTPEGRHGLVAMLDAERAPVVVSAIVTVLAPWIRVDAALATALVEAYEHLTHDATRSAILAALTSGRWEGDAAALLTRALRSPAPALRQWGVVGFLRLDPADFTPDLITAAGEQLARLGPGGGWAQGQQRRHLLRKLAVCRPLPAEILRLAREDEEAEIRRLATSAVQDAAGGEVAVDWNDWYDRIAVRRDAAGVFPAIFTVVEQDRAAAARVLHAAALALLGDGLANTRMGMAELVPWLAGLDAIDAQLVRATALHLRGLADASGNVNGLLAVLRAHPQVDEILPTVAHLLRRRRELECGLVRCVVLAACADDHERMVAWFGQELSTISDPAVAQRLVPFIERAEAWIRPEAIIRHWHRVLAARPGGEGLGRDLLALAKRWDLTLDTPTPGRPGLLDDE